MSHPERSPEPEQLDDAPKILCSPYIRELSEKIEKVWENSKKGTNASEEQDPRAETDRSVLRDTM